jgi:CBS domain-containing protein
MRTGLQSDREYGMKALDVMVRDVVTIRPDATVKDAVDLLVKYDISAIPVVGDDGAVVGIISEADLIRRKDISTEKQRPWWLEAITPATTLAAEFAKSHGQRVHEVMSTQVVSAAAETPLSEIATLLERHRIKRVPIIEDGKLIGIVSRANLIQALASSSSATGALGVSSRDREIRLALLTRLGEQRWTDFGSRNVTVTGGVVHLWGLVGSKQERKALVALAEEIPGVKGVADEMISAY